jgi:choline dehydrogenase-like flavoprotein
MGRRKTYDAIIVGSGATGSWAASALTRAGLDVLVVEAGPRLALEEHWPADPPGQDVEPEWERQVREHYPVQSRCPGFGKKSARLFADDADNPYATPADMPFVWIRTRVVGGRAAIWGGVSLRMSDLEFAAEANDGYGSDWPLSYAELAPYYERVEKRMGVTGSREGLRQLPDGAFLPAAALTRAEQELKAFVERRWPERRVVPARIMTGEVSGLLHEALSSGRATLRCNTMASHLLVNDDSANVEGVAVIDRIERSTEELYGRVVLLCASTIESVRLMLNSITPQHPAGVGNSSGLLGCYLMDHLSADPVAIGAVDGLGNETPPWGCFLVPRFRNVTSRHPDFLRGYGLGGVLGRNQSDGDTAVLQLWAQGEVLARRDNRVTIERERTDSWGIPVPRIELAYGDNERAMIADWLAVVEETLRGFGMDGFFLQPEVAPPGASIHELGGARMGDNPRTSVLNPYNQCWDAENLFVTDGACFASSGWQNPTLTMMAITARACDHILARLKRGDL